MDEMPEKQKLNPTALALEDAAALLTKLATRPVTTDMLQVDIAGGAPLGGFINEARIYDSTLSPADMAALFALGPDQVEGAAIPEPSTCALCIIGLLALSCGTWRRRRRTA